MLKRFSKCHYPKNVFAIFVFNFGSHAKNKTVFFYFVYEKKYSKVLKHK